MDRISTVARHLAGLLIGAGLLLGQGTPLPGPWLGGGGTGGTGTPCTTTALSLQYNNAGSFGCATDFTFASHAITSGASGILNVASGKIVVPSSFAGTGLTLGTVSGSSQIVPDTSYFNGLYLQLIGGTMTGQFVTSLSATTAGLRITGGTLPSTQNAGDVFCNASSICGNSNGTDAFTWVRFQGSGVAYAAAPTATHMVKWGANYTLTTTGAATWATADIADSAITTVKLAATDFGAGTAKTFSLNSGYYECTGTCTITMPVPAEGQQYCVRNANNVATVITFAAIGSSARYEVQAKTSYGTAGTGTFVSGGAIGDQVCLVGKDSTHFDIWSINGTWTAN